MTKDNNISWRGDKIGKMSKKEIDEFLSEPWIARLACIKPDGSPFVVPVWYHWDELILGSRKKKIPMG